ncbi:hypothetical protein FO519_004427 [Halicephalobus sp. NKZ332]|nr:hypothetical protein FO519_004427 [Halicephalobus sp. NKZ332]
MNQSVQPPPGLAPPGMAFPQQAGPMEQENAEDSSGVPPLSLDQKLQNLIISHLSDPGILMMRKMFAPVAETLDCRDVLIAEACMMLDYLNQDDLFQVIFKTIELVKNAKGKERQQDDLLTDIVIGLHENDLLSASHALVLMINSVDTRMIIPLSKKKLGFIKEKIAASNYKIVKEVLKAAFNEFSNLVPVITEQALDNFRPFEDTLIELLKRENNMAPGLMLQNEICRLNSNHQAYMLRRLAEASGDVERSFRPLAIISEVVGRPYLFPAFGHPGITSTKQWVLDNSVHLRLSRFIPHSTDNHAPQTFFQYIMLKQPWYLLKQEHQQNKEETAPFQGFFSGLGSCTSVLLILILEAMAAMEETDLPMEHPLNQYNWQHLSEMCTFCLLGTQANFDQLLEMLHSQLSELKYRKARGELMRLLLQYVAIVVHACLDKARPPPNGFDFYGKLRDLYVLLYPEERFETNVAATNECLKLVRYFAPAAIWINLSALPDVPIDQPSNLARLVQIIKEILESEKIGEEGFGTIVANAYTGDNTIFTTKFCHNIICKLETPKTSIILPYGKQGFKGDMALDIAFLESLNVCACQQLLQFLYDHINKYLREGNLPAPALMESLARIHSISDVKGATMFLYREFKDILNVSAPSSSDITKLMVLSEYFSMRIKVLSEMSIYSPFILYIYDGMKMMTDDPRYLSCYFSLQMQLIRWFLWCPPYAFCQNAQIMISMYKNPASRHQVKFNIFKETDSFRKGDTACSPELMKIYLLHYLRTSKLTNLSIESKPVSELIQDFDKSVIMYQQIPEGSKKWIPESFKNAVVSQPAIYLYRTLYSFPSQLIRHDWIRKCIRHIALLDRDHKALYKYYMLSENFIDRFDVASPTEICSLLIERINRATTYKHQPPHFCSKDWRFAELPPAAATLVGANIELMISKYEPETLVEALLRCAFKKPLEKPFEVINAIGLILTTLPEAFQKSFIEKCESFINFKELIEEDKPEILLESFLVDGYLATDNDPITAIAVIHSFTQHCSSGGLPLIYQLVENIHGQITTESQLLFMMRIIVPILHRVPDQTKVNFIICICKSINLVSKKKEKLDFEDTYCDLIYEMKYTVLGFIGMEKLESLILQFPRNLKEKMKYFYSSKEEHDAVLVKQKERILQQQLSQQMIQARHQQLQHHPSFQGSIQISNQNFPDNRNMKQGIQQVRVPAPGINQDIQIKERIEPEMVAPPVRAETLPEMTYQPAIIRPPEIQGMPPNRPQGLRAPGMIQNMGNLPPMPPQTAAPGMPGMNMNPMGARMPQMGPPGSQMSSMMPPNFVPPNNPNMNSQHPGFIQNQPSMYMPPGAGGGQIPQTSSDGMMNSGPPFGMMNSGFPGGQIPQGSQIPMGMPNQGGLIGPPNMMNQGGIGPPHMMPGPQQGYAYGQGMRQPMPPYQPGMGHPR